MKRRGRTVVDRSMQYLARMATRQKVEPSELFNYIVEAWKSERSKREQLKITCREKRKDSAVFLFTQGSEITAQFPVPTKILEGKNQLEGYVAAIPVRARAKKTCAAYSRFRSWNPK